MKIYWSHEQDDILTTLLQSEQVEVMEKELIAIKFNLDSVQNSNFTSSDFISIVEFDIVSRYLC